jgi:hypothetical protein
MLPQKTATPGQNPKTPYEQAEHGIPHCQFERTKEGLKVSFKRMPKLFLIGTIVSIFVLILPVAILLFIDSFKAFLLILAAVGAGCFFYIKLPPTRIEITPDAVIINGKILNRQDFGSFSFSIWTFQQKTSTTNFGVLEYTYGRRTFTFGGLWGEREAVEVASALNDHLRMTPQAGNDHNPQPEQLRAARPTDF